MAELAIWVAVGFIAAGVIYLIGYIFGCAVTEVKQEKSAAAAKEVFTQKMSEARIRLNGGSDD